MYLVCLLEASERDTKRKSSINQGQKVEVYFLENSKLLEFFLKKRRGSWSRAGIIYFFTFSHFPTVFPTFLLHFSYIFPANYSFVFPTYFLCFSLNYSYVFPTIFQRFLCRAWYTFYTKNVGKT